MLQTLFFENYLLFTTFLSYATAQVIKTILYSIMTRRIDLRRLIGAGGMPSSHSATVVALSVAAIRKCGPADPITAVTIILAAIVLHDAIGVRQQTGKHAKLLNLLLRKDFFTETTQAQLNEMVGHNGLQVIMGALIGIVLTLCIEVF